MGGLSPLRHSLPISSAAQTSITPLLSSIQTMVLEMVQMHIKGEPPRSPVIPRLGRLHATVSLQFLPFQASSGVLGAGLDASMSAALRSPRLIYTYKKGHLISAQLVKAVQGKEHKPKPLN